MNVKVKNKKTRKKEEEYKTSFRCHMCGIPVDDNYFEIEGLLLCSYCFSDYSVVNKVRWSD